MCKCGAKTFAGHLRKCRSGYPGHVYTGGLGMPFPIPPIKETNK